MDTFRMQRVLLPNGIEADEFDEPAAKERYEYLSDFGTRIRKDGFPLDSNGRILGIKVLAPAQDSPQET